MSALGQKTTSKSYHRGTPAPNARGGRAVSGWRQRIGNAVRATPGMIRDGIPPVGEITDTPSAQVTVTATAALDGSRLENQATPSRTMSSSSR